MLYISLFNGSPFSKQEDEKGFITTDGGGTVMGELGSPESLPEMERPPLRKIDMYIRPDCPCCNMTKRYTVAFLASIGTLKTPWFWKKQTNCDDDCWRLKIGCQEISIYCIPIEIHANDPNHKRNKKRLADLLLYAFRSCGSISGKRQKRLYNTVYADVFFCCQPKVKQTTLYSSELRDQRRR